MPIVLIGGLQATLDSYAVFLDHAASVDITFFVPAHAKHSVRMVRPLPVWRDGGWQDNTINFGDAGTRLTRILYNIRSLHSGRVIVVAHSLGATLLCSAMVTSKMKQNRPHPVDEIHLVAPAWALHSPEAGSWPEWLALHSWGCYSSLRPSSHEPIHIGAGLWLLQNRKHIARLLEYSAAQGIHVAVYWCRDDTIVSRHCGVYPRVPTVVLPCGHDPFNSHPRCVDVSNRSIIFHCV
jgi:alpha-beta hydrolase superfamily lysophospholipase